MQLYKCCKVFFENFVLLYFVGYESDTVTVDAARNIEPSVNNYGFMIRSRWFRNGRQAGQAYKPEGTTFLGKFQVTLFI